MGNYEACMSPLHPYHTPVVNNASVLKLGINIHNWFLVTVKFRKLFIIGRSKILFISAMCMPQIRFSISPDFVFPDLFTIDDRF